MFERSYFEFHIETWHLPFMANIWHINILIQNILGKPYFYLQIILYSTFCKACNKDWII